MEGADLAAVSTPCVCQSAWNGGPGLPAAPWVARGGAAMPRLWVLPGSPSLCPLRWRDSAREVSNPSHPRARPGAACARYWVSPANQTWPQLALTQATSLGAFAICPHCTQEG